MRMRTHARTLTEGKVYPKVLWHPLLLPPVVSFWFVDDTFMSSVVVFRAVDHKEEEKAESDVAAVAPDVVYRSAHTQKR